MNRKLKKLLTAVLVLTLALTLTACTDNWEAPYASLQDSGYNIAVRFDVNGGLFAGTKEVSVVDVFSPENGKTNSDGTVSFYLLTPEDTARKEGAFAASKNGYFLAGWYSDRSLRVDENGQPLDDYGVLCSQSGRQQGYTYSGKWDFDSDSVTVDASASYSADQPVLTLYAAWIPYINYDFYAVDESGTATYLSTTQTIDLEIPVWSEKTGKLDLKKFPDPDGKTFDAAYLDEGLTQPLTETIHGQDSYVDYETGTLSTDSVKIYTTWLDGTWFKIYTAQQFISNARPDGNYMICAETIDFEGGVWPPALVKGKFTGRIYGNGCTFTGITAVQGDNSQIYGGLFGSIESSAVISDITFENVTFTIEAGSRMQGASFGLLCGSAASGAVFENVNVTGKLLISPNCYPQSDYTIGLLSGSGSCEGVSYDISCSVAEDNTDAISVTVHDDGSVSVVFNP